MFFTAVFTHKFDTMATPSISARMVSAKGCLWESSSKKSSHTPVSPESFSTPRVDLSTKPSTTAVKAGRIVGSILKRSTARGRINDGPGTSSKNVHFASITSADIGNCY